LPGFPLWLALAFLFPPGRAFSAREFEKVATVGAQFLKFPVGARATGMGGAFTSVADDASCVWWNLGGLARLSGRTLAAHQTPWYAGIQFTQVTYVTSVRILPGNFALHLRSLSMPDEEVRTVFRPDGDGTYFDAGDLAVGLAYSRSLTDKFSAGLDANYVQSVLATYTGHALTFDFGTLYDTGFRSLRIGMQIQNIGSQMTFVEQPVKVPTLFRVGMSARLLDRSLHRLLVAGEFSHPPDNTERANFGLEYSLQETIALRGGWFYRYDLERASLGAGVIVPVAQLTEGRVDYSYTEMQTLPGVHRVSLEVRF
jgi:hypothetical protein